MYNISLGLPLGVEALVMTPNSVIFVFFSFSCKPIMPEHTCPPAAMPVRKLREQDGTRLPNACHAASYQLHSARLDITELGPHQQKPAVQDSVVVQKSCHRGQADLSTSAVQLAVAQLAAAQ